MQIYQTLFLLSKRPKLLSVGLFCTAFLCVSLVTTIVSVLQVRNALKADGSFHVAEAEPLDHTVRATLAALSRDPGAVPCSPKFMKWLNGIAFLPDGIHEIIYTDDEAKCSVTHGKLPQSFELGEPDLRIAQDKMAFWLDRNLSALGYHDLKGSLLQTGNFTIILPPLQTAEATSSWTNRQYITPLGDEDGWHHRIGRIGLIDRYHASQPDSFGFNLDQQSFWGFQCSDSGLICLISEAPLSRVLEEHKLIIAVLLMLTVTLSFAAKDLGKAFFARLWSLPQRFRRTLSHDSIICHYQPVISLHSGEVEGVEVLARWKDLDGTLVYPDKFLSVVEDYKLSRLFTKIVIENAARDLGQLSFSTDSPRVNINVFPQDFDAAWLIDGLAPLLACHNGLKPVVEIVETGDLDLDCTSNTIAFLRANGIETYIDDFGVGYSSIHYLSAVASDGVKLDRFFAAAPEGSMTSTMMFGVIDMISKTGQTLVIEGVETRECLMMLRATNTVDYVQGYYFSPPLPIARFATYLATFKPDMETLPNSVLESIEKLQVAFP